jgi:hypothetical protein
MRAVMRAVAGEDADALRTAVVSAFSVRFVRSSSIAGVILCAASFLVDGPLSALLVEVGVGLAFFVPLLTVQRLAEYGGISPKGSKKARKIKHRLSRRADQLRDHVELFGLRGDWSLSGLRSALEVMGAGSAFGFSFRAEGATVLIKVVLPADSGSGRLLVGDNVFGDSDVWFDDLFAHFRMRKLIAPNTDPDGVLQPVRDVLLACSHDPVLLQLVSDIRPVGAALLPASRAIVYVGEAATIVLWNGVMHELGIAEVRLDWMGRSASYCSTGEDYDVMEKLLKS